MFADSYLMDEKLQANPTIERNIAKYKGLYFLFYWILSLIVSGLLKN